MTPEEQKRYIHLGIEADIHKSAGALEQSIATMRRTLQEAGGQVYTSARFAAPIHDMRMALDRLEAAIGAKESIIVSDGRPDPESGQQRLVSPDTGTQLRQSSGQDDRLAS